MHNDMQQVGDVEIDRHDLPFKPPPQHIIAVDLPPPLSVNRTRKIDWASKRKVDAWIRRADMSIMAGGGVRKLGAKIPGRFEVRIVLDEALSGIDLDNTPKLLIDYCRHLGLIVNDSPKYMRRVVLEWGDPPTGCRITLKELG